MAEFLYRLGAALLDASLATTAISGFVVLAMIQSRQPARRLGWARVGLISTLAVLPLAALNPLPRFDLPGHVRSILPTEHDHPSSIRPRRPEHRRGPHVPPDFSDAEPDPAPRSPRDPEAESPRPPCWWIWTGRGLVLAYLMGLTTGLGLLGLGAWGSSLLIRGAARPSDHALSIYDSLSDPAGTPKPRLGISTRVGRPVLVGLLRPSILIPPGLDRPEQSERLRLGLLHELAHARSSDHLFGLVANLAQAIWFFLPPVWWIRDQMKLDQEFLADRGAAEQFGASGRYASSLVDLASSEVPGRAGRADPVVETGASGVASALFQRVLMLLKCPFALESRTPVWWRWAAASTMALATLAASCLTIRDLGGWSTEGATPAPESPRSFKIPQLVIGQGEKDDKTFDLRFRLPDQFRLTLEILAEPPELSAFEVLGHRLGPAADRGRAAVVYRLWHRVKIRRSGGVEDVEVDGEPVADPSRIPKLATWLSIRAQPGRTTRIRDLELTW